MKRTQFLLKSNPFILITTAFVLGIVLQDLLHLNYLFSLIGVILCLSFILASWAKGWLLSPGRNSIKTAILLMALVFSGSLFHLSNSAPNKANWYGHFTSDTSTFLLKINQQPIEKENSFVANCVIEATIAGAQKIETTGEILVYFKKSDTIRELKYGQLIMLKAKLQAIKSNGHPGGFNYQSYMARQQIFHQVYVTPKDIIVLPTRRFHLLYTPLFFLKSYVLQLLKKRIRPAELGIAQALLIGYTNDLDRDLLQAYSDVGVVHVIAVSGMHLALIYKGLNALLSLFGFFRKRNIVKSYVILAVLWSFALLAGAAPSILRAAVMFTIVTVGQSNFAKPSLLNTLFNTAFVLLCINTNNLWDVGFQLSFIALFSIAVCNEPIRKWFVFSNYWLQSIWELTAATIAAQVFTAPLIIYYFHQFPLLFLVGNLIAVPLSSIALVGELLLVFVGEVPWLGMWLGALVSWLLKFMNIFVQWMSSFSFAALNDITVTIGSTLLLYALVCAMAIWLLHQQKRLAKTALLIFIVWLSSIQWEKFTKFQQQHFVVYNVSRHWAFEYIRRNQYSIWADSTFLNNSKIRQFNLKSSHHFLQANAENSTMAFEENGFLQVGILRLFHAKRQSLPMQAFDSVKIDYAILSQNTKLGPKQIRKFCQPKLFIFDASNAMWKIEKWKTECNELNLPFYSVPEQGTFHCKF